MARRGLAMVFAAIVISCSGGPSADDLADARSALEDNLAFVTQSWPTDWTNRTVGLDELILGVGATEPRDAIPPIDLPDFESVTAAAQWLEDGQPGVLLQLGDEARFYPLAIMVRHEIVNDTFGEVPVALTYCPLCNTALAFDRRVGGETLRFGVSGILRNSDLVMWDDRTVSLWQQVTGEAIVGDHAGTVLTPLATSIVAFSDFREGFPDGRSLSRDTGFDLDYGLNRYNGYSTRITPLFPVEGERDTRYPALERVVGVTEGSSSKAYPFSTLEVSRVINDELDGEPVTVWWGSGGTLDPLNRERIADSRSIGTGVAYRATVDGQRLTFRSAGDVFVDDETGSTWSILGQAIEGQLAGQRLDVANHRNEFWFAWTAFFPDGLVHEP